MFNQYKFPFTHPTSLVPEEQGLGMHCSFPPCGQEVGRNAHDDIILFLTLFCSLMRYFRCSIFIVMNIHHKPIFSPKLRQHVDVCVCVLSAVVSDSLPPYGLQLTRLLCPWSFPGKNTGPGGPFPIPRDFLNPGIKPVSLGSPVLSGIFFTTAPPALKIQLVCLVVLESHSSSSLLLMGFLQFQ